MSTPFGVTALVSRARAFGWLAGFLLVTLAASPVLAKTQPASSQKAKLKAKPAVEELPTLWIGPKPATAAPAITPSTASAPVRVESPAAPAPALLSAIQPAAAAAPAKGAETSATRIAPKPVKTQAPVEAPGVESKPLPNDQPLIFTSSLGVTATPKPREASKRNGKVQANAPAKKVDSPSNSRATMPRTAAAPAPAVTPAPALAAAPASKAPAQDLDDLPLDSVLSKNTAGEGKSQRSTGNLVADVLTKLAFVILLGLGAAAGWKKFQGQSFARPAKPQTAAEVASVLPLGPQRSVHLLRIGNQTLVVASTPQNVSLLATIDDSQAAEAGLLAGEANETEPDFQTLIGHLVQGGAIQSQEKVEPVRVEAVEETGGRAFTGLKGSLFSAATPVSGSRADA